MGYALYFSSHHHGYTHVMGHGWRYGRGPIPRHAFLFPLLRVECLKTLSENIWLRLCISNCISLRKWTSVVYQQEKCEFDHSAGIAILRISNQNTQRWSRNLAAPRASTLKLQRCMSITFCQCPPIN